MLTSIWLWWRGQRSGALKTHWNMIKADQGFGENFRIGRSVIVRDTWSTFLWPQKNDLLPWWHRVAFFSWVDFVCRVTQPDHLLPEMPAFSVLWLSLVTLMLFHSPHNRRNISSKSKRMMMNKTQRAMIFGRCLQEDTLSYSEVITETPLLLIPVSLSSCFLPSFRKCLGSNKVL